MASQPKNRKLERGATQLLRRVMARGAYASSPLERAVLVLNLNKATVSLPSGGATGDDEGRPRQGWFD